MTAATGDDSDLPEIEADLRRAAEAAEALAIKIEAMPEDNPNAVADKDILREAVLFVRNRRLRDRAFKTQRSAESFMRSRPYEGAESPSSLIH